jgi:hypothetical protein
MRSSISERDDLVISQMDLVQRARAYTRDWVTEKRVDLVGTAACAAGPLLMLLYIATEAVFGASQPNGGPLRMALGFSVVCAGLVCFGLALLRLHAQVPSTPSRIRRAGAALSTLSVGLLVIGSALWWPVLFIRPDLGPLAGAPVGLGVLSLFGAWLLLGLWSSQQRSFPTWARPLPLALLGLFALLLFVTGVLSPWPLVAAVFVPFAFGWLLMAYGIWRVAAVPAPSQAPGVLI